MSAASAKSIFASERVIQAVLEKAAHRARLSGLGAGTQPSPDAAAMAKDAPEDLARDGFFADSLEEDSITYFQASDAAMAVLCFIFAHGPHPKVVLTRTVWLADKVAPELLLKMSGRDWAKILNETPWAWHARDQAIRQQVAKAARLRSEIVTPTQKSSAARKRMARAARGNKHRAESVAA